MMNRIIGFIGWLGFAAVLAAVAIRLGVVTTKSEYGVYLSYAGLVCLLIYILGQWRDIAKLFARRQARYGALSLASVLIVLGILIAINYIGARQNKRWDLTANQQFSLSDQTTNVLKKLDAPLNIQVFAEEPSFQQYRDRLKEYEYASKNVTTEYIDPERKPTAAANVQLQQPVTMVIGYKGRTERVTSSTEQDITAGIIKVVQGQQKKIYFSEGHGEKDPTSAERDGYKDLADSLTRENYTVAKLGLTQGAGVPDDAAVVVIAGATTDFLPAEIDALNKYLAKGGKLLLEIDPPAKADRPELTNLIALAHSWGIDVGSNIILDASGVGQLIGASEAVPVATRYPAHPITQRFRVMTAFPLARALTVVSGGVGGHTAQAFAETSEQSVAKADVKGLLGGKGSLKVEQGDKAGPLTIGAAVSASPASAPAGDANAPKNETRVVVYGDSDFAANYALRIQGNRDLFMNTMGWLSQQENLISIRPKEPGDRRLTMTPAQASQVTLLSLLIIPGLVFGAGVYSWWRRR